MLRGSRISLLPARSTKMLLAITKVPKSVATQQEAEGSAEQSPADQMLLIENKLATLKKQLSHEKTPNHVASSVMKNIEIFLSNLEFPISDKALAQMYFKGFGQKPLQSLYFSLWFSNFELTIGRPSEVTAAIGLELAKLCGLNERSAIMLLGSIKGLIFRSSKLSDGPNPFIIALLAGRIDVAKLIIEEDKENSEYWDDMVYSFDTERRVNAGFKISPLELISAAGDHKSLRYLLSLNILARQKRNENWTPLLYASLFSKVDNMKVLIDEGKHNVNEKRFYSPLHLTLYSAERRSFEAFSLLLEKGAYVNEPDVYGVTPLHLAAEKDDGRFMEALLARDADVKKLDNTKQSPLHKAAGNGNVKALEALLARGSDINGLCDKKKSSLHYAIEGGHDAAAEFLITKGAKVTKEDAEGRTPLHIAIGKDRAHIVKLLLAKGVHKGSGDSFLVEAAKIGNVEVIEALIAAGASPCTKHKTPPWFAAAYNDKKEAFPILLAYSVASVSNVRLILKKQYSEQLLSARCCGDVLNGNALHWASRLGDIESVRLLIEKGANANDTNCTRGRTPLHFAAEHNHVALIKLLVSKGADIQSKDNYGWSPLHSAANAKKHEAMSALVELGADLTVKTKSGKTPLTAYTRYCQRDDGIVSLLTPKQNK